MLVAGLAARGFRNLADDTVIELGPGLALITGENGAGKTNLLESLFVGLTGASPRTNRLREVVGFESAAARVTVRLSDPESGVEHEIVNAIAANGERRRSLDGAPPSDAEPPRPPVVVFMPDRLELVKGPPSVRRGHLDQFMSALWRAAAGHRRAYGAALAQRNAQLGAIRAGRGARSGLAAWNETLAAAGAELAAARSSAVELLAEPFRRWCEELGLAGAATVEYRPRVDCAGAPEVLREALEERVEADIERGHTTTGPHHDELALDRSGRALRRYGSQGEQRLTLLGLLLAEREVIAEQTKRAPVALFDDVMSELDPRRRSLLASALGRSGQALVTTTDAAHVPEDAKVAAHWQVDAGVVSSG